MTKREKIILLISLILLAFVILIYFIWLDFVQVYDSLLSALISVLTGIVTSIFLLVINRKDRYTEILSFYEDIPGTYKRKFIAQYSTAEENQGYLITQNVGLNIEIAHEGENNFSFIAKYWKDDGHIATGMLQFNENSKYFGTGNYKYTTKAEEDVGKYAVQRFKEHPNRIMVYYENTIPKSGATGFEIWEK